MHIKSHTGRAVRKIVTNKACPLCFSGIFAQLTARKKPEMPTLKRLWRYRDSIIIKCSFKTYFDSSCAIFLQPNICYILSNTVNISFFIPYNMHENGYWDRKMMLILDLIYYSVSLVPHPFPNVPNKNRCKIIGYSLLCNASNIQNTLITFFHPKGRWLLKLVTASKSTWLPAFFWITGNTFLFPKGKAFQTKLVSWPTQGLVEEVYTHKTNSLNPKVLLYNLQKYET